MNLASPSLRARIRAGDTVVGAWMFTPNPSFAELAGLAGIDFLLVDLEHGAITLADLPNLLRGLQGSKTSAVIRVPSHDATLIGRVLDRGAHGILVPRVDDAATAASVAAAARFPPTGQRGLALGAIRASGYGLQADYRALSEDVLVAVQIESRHAVEHALEIARAPGVDLAFIGPNDLSAALAMDRPDEAPRFARLVDDLFAKLQGEGIRTGTIPHGGRDWQALARAGVQMLVAGADTVFMKEGLLALKHQQRQAAGARSGS